MDGWGSWMRGRERKMRRERERVCAYVREREREREKVAKVTQRFLSQEDKQFVRRFT